MILSPHNKSQAVVLLYLIVFRAFKVGLERSAFLIGTVVTTMLKHKDYDFMH